jgi:hypothetical protein
MTLLAPESNAACSAAVESSAFQPNDEAFTTFSAPNELPIKQNTAIAEIIAFSNAFIEFFIFSIPFLIFKVL